MGEERAVDFRPDDCTTKVVALRSHPWRVFDAAESILVGE